MAKELEWQTTKGKSREMNKEETARDITLAECQYVKALIIDEKFHAAYGQLNDMHNNGYCLKYGRIHGEIIRCSRFCPLHTLPAKFYRLRENGGNYSEHCTDLLVIAELVAALRDEDRLRAVKDKVMEFITNVVHPHAISN